MTELCMYDFMSMSCYHNLISFLGSQEIMSVDDESTSCYCLMDSHCCHLLLDQPGCYALVGEPVTDSAIKRLRIAVFGSMEASSMDYNLRVHCVDDTPHAFQVRAGQSTCSHYSDREQQLGSGSTNPISFSP